MYRQDRKSVQRIKARDIVPGDIVEVAGKILKILLKILRKQKNCIGTPMNFRCVVNDL